ncbi:YidH family protein [Nocardioides koreensis]
MDEPRSSGRRPRLREVGESPDYRFTLANERTFLAWVRTALAMMAAGVAVIRFVPGLTVIRHGLGFLLIGIGGLLAAASYRHWERNERAMRLGRELPQSFIPRLVAGSLVLAALVALALVIVDLAD